MLDPFTKLNYWRICKSDKHLMKMILKYYKISTSETSNL